MLQWVAFQLFVLFNILCHLCPLNEIVTFCCNNGSPRPCCDTSLLGCVLTFSSRKISIDEISNCLSGLIILFGFKCECSSMSSLRSLKNMIKGWDDGFSVTMACQGEKTQLKWINCNYSQWLKWAGRFIHRYGNFRNLSPLPFTPQPGSGGGNCGYFWKAFLRLTCRQCLSKDRVTPKLRGEAESSGSQSSKYSQSKEKSTTVKEHEYSAVLELLELVSPRGLV